MMPRLTSDFFVSAYLRLCAHQGVAGVLRQRGAAEAGAVFILIDRLDGKGTLYGPAPQTEYEGSGDRAFTRLHAQDMLPLDALEAILARERRFDPDIWVVAIEDRAGRHFLDRVT